MTTPLEWTSLEWLQFGLGFISGFSITMAGLIGLGLYLARPSGSVAEGPK